MSESDKASIILPEHIIETLDQFCSFPEIGCLSRRDCAILLIGIGFDTYVARQKADSENVQLTAFGEELTEQDIAFRVLKLLASFNLSDSASANVLEVEGSLLKTMTRL